MVWSGFFPHLFPLCSLLRCIISWGLGFLICSLVCPTTLPTCCVAVVSFIRTCALTDSFRFNFFFSKFPFYLQCSFCLLSVALVLSYILANRKFHLSTSHWLHTRTHTVASPSSSLVLLFLSLSLSFFSFFVFIFESRPSQISF